MIKATPRRLALLALFCLRVQAAAAEAPRSDVYFVVVGSQHYTEAPNRFDLSWERIAAPVHSASRVAGLLQGAGARYGIELGSTLGHAVSKADMQRAIVDVKTRIRQDGARHPIFIFYYIGHGLGDTYSQTLYLAPGNMTLVVPPSQTATNMLERSTLSNLEVIASLEMFRLPPVMAFEDRFFISDLAADFTNPADVARAGQVRTDLTQQDDFNRQHGLYPPGRVPPVPFIALFDNCYDKVAQDLVEQKPQAEVPGNPLSAFVRHTLEATLKSARDSMLTDLADAQSDGLVLYATKPGTTIGDFADPDPAESDPVGSLARRLLLAIPQGANLGRMTFRELRAAMNDERAKTFGNGGGSYSIAAPTPYSIESTTDAILDGATIARFRLESGATGMIEHRTGSAPIDRP